MARTAPRKLSSEERCRKRYVEWRGASFQAMDGYDQMLYNAWRAAWQYLERNVTEWVKS